MLFNPKWEVKADPFSLESLVAWLEKQSPEGRYSFINSKSCLLAQWVLSIDPHAEENYSDNSYGYIVRGRAVNFKHFRDIVNSGEEKYQTFGRALARAREKLASR